MKCARRSDRRLLIVHQTGGLKGLLVWMNWKTGSRMKLKITVSSEATLSLNPRLRPPWVPWNQDGHDTGLAQSRAEGTLNTNTQTVRQLPRTFQNQILRGWLVALGVIIVGKLAILGRNCPKKRARAFGGDAGVRAVSCDLELTAIAHVLSAHESHLEKLVREERWKRLTLEQNEADKSNQSDAEVLRVCHRPSCAVPDTVCGKTLIGQSAVKRYVKVNGNEPRWLSHVRQ